jgi:hypothetical protein
MGMKKGRGRGGEARDAKAWFPDVAKAIDFWLPVSPSL